MGLALLGLSASGRSWERWKSAARLRRLRSLFALLALYACALLFVMQWLDGADVGCVLVAIAGHVLYATHGLLASWRAASWLEDARERILVELRA